MIAFGIWAFVINERDPDSTHVDDEVEIEVKRLTDNLRIVDSLPTVTATLKGPQSILRGVADAPITASVDMSDINEPGTYELDVEVQAPDGLRDIDVEPATIMVEIDSVISETFEIAVVEPVDSPETLTSISLSMPSVTLVGVQRNVEAVERVEVTVLLSGRTESFSYTAQPVPVDSEGRQIDSGTVEVRPESVQVSVEFEVGSRSVPVIVQCACRTEGGGLEIRDLMTATAIPPTVRIEGPQPLIADIDAVRTVPIDVENVEVSGFMTGTVNLDDSNLPEGVTLGIPSVGVYVQVEPSTQELIQQEIQIINPPSDMLVDVSPTSVSFEVQGSPEALATLGDNPPIAVIDLADYEEGVYTLSARIVLPPDVRFVNLEPAEIQVTIESPPPPTPTPTPAPAPEPTVKPSSSTRSSEPAQSYGPVEPVFSDTIN